LGVLVRSFVFGVASSGGPTGTGGFFLDAANTTVSLHVIATLTPNGTSPNGSDWSYTPACAIGISVWGDALPTFPPDAKGLATRKASEAVMQVVFEAYQPPHNQLLEPT
ncbi:MAG: hypothetical protein B7Z73_08410, partial [Planctomycetia bacterium 21-64-5]